METTTTAFHEIAHTAIEEIAGVPARTGPEIASAGPGSFSTILALESVA